MAIRNIVKEGDDTLTKVCRPVETFDDRLRQLVSDMKETLVKADGLGLAAPQVGVLKRLFILFDEDETMKVLINPQIISAEGEQVAHEGCLSVPGIWGETVRPAHVVVRALDENGKPFEMDRTGITAVCLCHENDHLDGKLFREHVTKYIDIEE